MDNKDNFEKYIKESLENFEPDFDLNNWDLIEKKLPKTMWYRAWYLPYLFSLFLFAIGLFIGYYFSNIKTSPPQTQTNSIVKDSIYVVKTDTVFVRGEKINVDSYNKSTATSQRNNPAILKNNFTNHYSANTKGAISSSNQKNTYNADSYIFDESHPSHAEYHENNKPNTQTSITINDSLPDDKNNSLNSGEKNEIVNQEPLTKDTLDDMHQKSITDTDKAWQFLLGTDATILFPFNSNLVEQEITFVPSLKLSAYYRKTGIHLGVGFLSLAGEIDKPERFDAVELEKSMPNYPSNDEVEEIDIYSTSIIFPASLSFNLNNDRRNQVELHFGILGRLPLGHRYTYDYQIPGFANQIEYMNNKDFHISHYTMGIGTHHMLSKNTDLYLGIEYYLASSNFKTRVNRLDPINFNGLSLTIGLKQSIFNNPKL